MKASLLRVAACVFIAACHGRSSPAPASTLKVLVYNVHAGKDAKGVDAIQRIADVVKSSGLQEIKTIIPLAKSERSTPVLFGGDFNSTPDSKVHNELRASGMRGSWTTCGTGDGLSYPADKPAKRIRLSLSPRRRRVHACRGVRVGGVGPPACAVQPFAQGTRHRLTCRIEG